MSLTLCRLGCIWISVLLFVTSLAQLEQTWSVQRICIACCCGWVSKWRCKWGFSSSSLIISSWLISPSSLILKPLNDRFFTKRLLLSISITFVTVSSSSSSSSSLYPKSQTLWFRLKNPKMIHRIYRNIIVWHISMAIISY